MNKIQKTIAILLIIVAVVLVAGCANKAPATENKTPAAAPAEKHPDQSKEWMQVTSADALNVSNAANALMSASLDGADSQKITNLMEEAKTSNYKAAQYYYTDDLEQAEQTYADMMDAYYAVGNTMKMAIDQQNAGNTAGAQSNFKLAQQLLADGNKDYEEYKTMIEDFKKTHP